MVSVKSKISSLLKYSYGIMGLRTDDILLISFPRAGSTWVRFVLCNYVSLLELEGQEVNFHAIDDYFPALGRSNLFETWRFNCLPRFVKTHQPYRNLLFGKPHRKVYILRDPRDVMVSYYRFRQASLEIPYKGSISDFIHHDKYGLRACINHYLEWKNHLTYTIRYEDLIKDASSGFRQMLDSIGIVPNNDSLDSAIRRSSFNEMRHIQEKNGLPKYLKFDKHYRLARKGISGDWVNYFSESNLDFYQQICEETGFDIYP